MGKETVKEVKKVPSPALIRQAQAEGLAGTSPYIPLPEDPIKVAIKDAMHKQLESDGKIVVKVIAAMFPNERSVKTLYDYKEQVLAECWERQKGNNKNTNTEGKE